MPTFMKNVFGAGLGFVLLVSAADTASAIDDDRAEWLRYLSAQRTRAGPVAAAAPSPVAASPVPQLRGVGTDRAGLRGELPISAGLVVRESGRPTAVSVAPAARAVAALQINPAFLPADVAYSGRHTPGTVVIDTEEKYLYLVRPGGQARRYGVGVGRPGFQWAGTHRVTMKQEWPGWTPPSQMRKRQPELPAFMAGGPDNPLGARAMYLGSTLYRIHGSNAPWTIGQEVSSGCIRMRNEDVVELYDQVKVGTRVVVVR